MAQTRSLGRPSLLLGLVLVLTWLVLFAPTPASLVPPAWPVVGVLGGLLLTAAPRRAGVLAGLTAVGLVGVQLLHGLAATPAVAFAAITVLEALLVARLVTAGGRRVPTLLADGDVTRMIRSVAIGSGLAAAGYGVVDLLSGHGDPWLAAVGAFTTHAASLVVILPVFLRTSDAMPAAPRGERVAQWVLAFATTVLIFSSSEAPPLVFLVMPMFAWLGYRGTLREATGVLLVVAAVATEATALGLGPVDALSTRYGLPAELVDAYLQVFLLDCALVLLPLSVAVGLQRRAAAEAVRGRDTLARIVDSATGTAILVTDLGGRVTVFNPGAESILGRRARDVVGQPADSLLDPEELGRLGAELGVPATFPDVCAALVGSEGPPRPWQFVRSGGDLRTLQVTVTALRDADGAMSGYLTTGEDVTERERARAALLLALDDREAAVQRLRALDRTRKNLLSTVSHELRTPITSILGYTEMLEDGMAGELAPRQSVMLGRVARNSHRLLELVENLITLSKAEAHNLRTDPARCDLVAVAQAAYAAAEPAARVHGVDLAFATDEAVVELWGDADQLQRMLDNLLSNAVKFTEEGGRVDLALRTTGEQAVLVVEDTGIGIPADERDQVFDQFFRSSLARDREIQGTGLGLSIVQAIVDQHGGTVTVESTPGSGSRFEVTLPSAHPADDGRGAAGARETLGTPAPVVGA